MASLISNKTCVNWHRGLSDVECYGDVGDFVFYVTDFIEKFRKFNFLICTSFRKVSDDIFIFGMILRWRDEDISFLYSFNNDSDFGVALSDFMFDCFRKLMDYELSFNLFNKLSLLRDGRKYSLDIAIGSERVSFHSTSFESVFLVFRTIRGISCS